MSDLETVRDLFRHMEWADATVWRAVPTERDTRVGEVLLHLHLTQRAFLSVWRNTEIEFPALESFADNDALMTWWRAYYEAATPYVESLDDDALARIITMPWAQRYAGRPPGPVTMKESLIQIAAHSTYHRGQVNARLRELGVTPPLVDYIAWLWHERPAPPWPVTSR